MIRHRLYALALAGVALSATLGPAWALDIPKASPKDAGIRSTDYDPNDVIVVPTTMGIATHIVLADDETFITHAFGDAAAYDFQQIGKHLLLKPVADQANTNLIVITDKRNYSFLLKYAKHRSGHAVQRITLHYPGAQQDENAKTAEAAQVTAALTQTAASINWKGYTMAGDHSLAPISAWDDGAQTWLRFAPGQDLPAVYYVDADGKEVIANRHMADAQTIVMHRVAAKWHLRLGDQVLSVFNEAGPTARSLPTRTLSPQVQRVPRKESSQ